MGDSKPKISVIMSTYNRQCFLHRAIGSVLSQTFDNFEFILVNNGSTDDTEEICTRFANEDSRIKVINIPTNRGASNGRNKGIDAASCELITFVDDDDYCEPQMLEFLYDLINTHDADISICGSWFDIDNKLEPKYIYDELLILDKVQGLDELLKREKYNVTPATKLYRKTCFADIRFEPNVVVDDIHTIYKVFAMANRVVSQGKPLYRFTKHLGNVTSFNQTNKITPALLSEYLSAFRERTKYLSNRVPRISMRVRYSEWSYMISMCDKIINNNSLDCAGLFELMVDSLKQNLRELMEMPYLTVREKELLAKYVSNDTSVLLNN